jgi:ubiquinone/menaquinone biosynthesis C-methylase UbiE
MARPGPNKTDFSDVTEMGGDPITPEQLERLYHRYSWAAERCRDKDVAELACGTGPGLGLLRTVARSLEAGDFSPLMVNRVRHHYGDRVPVRQFDAASMPYPDASKDVLMIFEALYYLPDVAAFFRECRRVLRPAGRLLIATANKDLDDFNPSPYSHRYLGAAELAQELGQAGFASQCYGYLDISTTTLRQRLLRPVKRFVVASGLMPRTMAGKRLLKRLVFGPPVIMPAELVPGLIAYNEPTPLPAGLPDRRHKVIYCAATAPA